MTDSQRLSEQNTAMSSLNQVLQHMSIGGHARVHMGNVIHAAPKATPPTPRAVIPFSRDPNFVGREDLLAKIFETLKPDEDAHRRMVLRGLGGIGKSQIAIEFAYRYRERYPDHWVFRVYAASQERFIDAFGDIAEYAGLATKDLSKNDLLKAVRRWLSSSESGKWLLIVDNADDQDVFGGSALTTERLSDYLSQAQSGNVLITTRNNVGISLCDINTPTETVNPLSMNSAWKLWKRLAASSEPRRQVESLLRKVDCIPLAIRQAAAYVRQTGISLKQYSTFLEQVDAENELWSQEWKDFRRQSEQSAVFLTWNVSLNQLRKHHPDALDTLMAMSMLGQAPIPENLFLYSTATKPQLEALGQLLAFSLVTRDMDQNTLCMHRLVYQCMQAWIKNENGYRACLYNALDHIFTAGQDMESQGDMHGFQVATTHALNLTWSLVTQCGFDPGGSLTAAFDRLLTHMLRKDFCLETGTLEKLLPLCIGRFGVTHWYTLQVRLLLCRGDLDAKKLDLATEHIHQLVRDLEQESSTSSTIAFAQAQTLLGHVLSACGKSGEALTCYLRAKPILQSEAMDEIELTYNTFRSVIELARALRVVYHDQHSNALLKPLWRRASKSADVMHLHACSWELGVISWDMEDVSAALEWFHLSMKVYKPNRLQDGDKYLVRTFLILDLLVSEELYDDAGSVLAEFETLLQSWSKAEERTSPLT